jgi:hypothetical protein
MAHDEQVSLCIILDGDGKQDDQHWALNISNQLQSLLTIQVLSLATWRLDIITPTSTTPNNDPSHSPSYAGTIPLTHVKAFDLPRIEQLARQLEMGRWPGWNCQDYVMDLLGALEKEGVIKERDGDYQGGIGRLRGILHCQHG